MHMKVLVKYRKVRKFPEKGLTFEYQNHALSSSK